MTRLLSKDDTGIKTLEEDPELIIMLEADLLLESKDEESYDIAKAYGKVFIDRPEKFTDQSLISMSAKMFTEKKKKKVKKEKKEEPKPEEQQVKKEEAKPTEQSAKKESKTKPVEQTVKKEE